MNSRHFVKGQSPQPGEGLELVVQSCGSSCSCAECSQWAWEVVGRGQRGEHRPGTPRPCCHNCSTPPPAPGERVILFSCSLILCFSCVNNVWNTDITWFHIACQCWSLETDAMLGSHLQQSQRLTHLVAYWSLWTMDWKGKGMQFTQVLINHHTRGGAEHGSNVYNSLIECVLLL